MFMRVEKTGRATRYVLEPTRACLPSLRLRSQVVGYPVVLSHTNKWMPPKCHPHHQHLAPIQSNHCKPIPRARLCENWQEMQASAGDPVNTHMCYYEKEWGAAGAAEMLRRFMNEHATVLRTVYNVTSCEHHYPARAYVTNTHRGLAPDDLHSDVAEADCHEPGDLTDEDPRFLTVLAYPHTNWQPHWQGHTEFAAANCSHAAQVSLFEPPALANGADLAVCPACSVFQHDRALGRKLPAVLRIAPMPGLTLS